MYGDIVGGRDAFGKRIVVRRSRISKAYGAFYWRTFRQRNYFWQRIASESYLNHAFRSGGNLYAWLRMEEVKHMPEKSIPCEPTMDALRECVEKYSIIRNQQ